MADNITIKDASGANVTIAADELAGPVYVQRIKRLVGPDGSAVDYRDSVSRSDTFTATGNGTTVDMSAQAVQNFGLQVKEAGTVTSWQVDLEVSLDGTNFVSVLSHTKASDGDGAVLFSGANRYPALYFRARCAALTLGGGTNVVATIVGMP